MNLEIGKTYIIAELGGEKGEPWYSPYVMEVEEFTEGAYRGRYISKGMDIPEMGLVPHDLIAKATEVSIRI